MKSETISLRSLAIKARALASKKAIEDQKKLRRFSTWEISNFMFHLPADTLRKKLLSDPSLPQGIIEPAGRQRWFALAEVNELRRRLRFRKHKLMPACAKVPAPHIAFLGTGQGVGTTTVVQHLAHAAALNGHRVLLIDLTANASLSQMHGAIGNLREVFTLDWVRNTNESREINPTKIVQATHWPNIDIIAADPKSPVTDRELLRLCASNQDWDPTDAIEQILDEQTILAYDFILTDCACDLDIKSWNGLISATQLNLVTGPEAADFANVSKYLDDLSGEALTFSDIQIYSTRFDPIDPDHKSARGDLLSVFGESICPPPINDISTISSSQNGTESVYEQDYRASTRGDWQAARASFDQAFARVLSSHSGSS